MISDRPVEQFATLFNQTFLPYGLALHSSMIRQEEPFHLWILCMDRTVHDQLKQLSLPHVTLIPLEEIETDRLRAVKVDRTVREYCWTMTPFIPQIVFERDPTIGRVTYLDADIFFFDKPSILIDEFNESRKHVLITEHAYAPEYDQTESSGRFCVQFMTFRNTTEAKAVMTWWQDKCVEWCFSRDEEKRLFGDQKYLDVWPDLFPDKIHILRQIDKALAPWNERYFERKFGTCLRPVFYHFHGLRLVRPKRIRLYHGYRIGPLGRTWYRVYLDAFESALNTLRENEFPIPVFINDPHVMAFWVEWIMKIKQRLRYAVISS